MSADSDMEYSDDDYDYYNQQDDCDIEVVDPSKNDPEFFPHRCLTVEEVEKLLNESVELLSNSLSITPSLAKVMLQTYEWNAQEIIQKYKENAHDVLVHSRVKPANGVHQPGKLDLCGVCAVSPADIQYSALSCGHSFCNTCWATHFEVQIQQGVSTTIRCMATDCEIRAPEDFVLAHVTKPALRDRYQQFMFQDHVKTHPALRFCPGPNCQVVLYATKQPPGVGRAECTSCNSLTCFACGAPHHAPTDCMLIRRWLTKCADDSETANYISAHTKDCPNCQICIEKNGGCNHMQCGSCRHDFCWVCLGEWRVHGSEYYECSRYKEDPNSVKDSGNALDSFQAREALKKYLHYYERWENHARSLKLEKETLAKLRSRINQKVMAGEGTWIDWQHLWAGASLLARCRYTLQYTYPYAYYMDAGPRKELFEYQQAQLEAEIENLSWKIERAETTDKGDLQNQMDIAEKRRTTLLKECRTDRLDKY